MVEIPQDIHLPVPQRERDQQNPQAVYGGLNSLEEQKGGNRVERKKKTWKLDFGHVFREPQLHSFGRGTLGAQPLKHHWPEALSSVQHHLLGSQGSLCGVSPVALALSTTAADGNARKVTAPKVDRDSIAAVDPVTSSEGGGSHSRVLWVRAEDGVWQNQHHRMMVVEFWPCLMQGSLQLLAVALGCRTWHSRYWL